MADREELLDVLLRSLAVVARKRAQIRIHNAELEIAHAGNRLPGGLGSLYRSVDGNEYLAVQDELFDDEFKKLTEEIANRGT